MTELQSHFDFLVDQWCESRALEPLRLLLNAKASLNGLSDGWAECRTNLQSIRVNYGSEISATELDALVGAIHVADRALDQDAT